jgi:nucleotide-binding universal stress UspA family protein
LHWATRQAGRSGQQVHAIICCSDSAGYADAPIAELGWESDVAGGLQDTVMNVLGEAEVPRVVRHVAHGDPAEILLRVFAGAGVLVIGSRGRGRGRGRGAFAGMLLGSVSQYVVAHATCPVSVLHASRTSTGTVVVSVDGSSESELALR